MFKQYLVFLIFLMPYGLLFSQETDTAHINVGQAQIKKSYAAIAPVRFLGTPSLSKQYLRYEKELQDVLEKDLTVSSYFTLQDPNSFLESNQKGLRPHPVEPNGFLFDAWKSINTEFLIKTGFNVVGDRMTFDAYVYNVDRMELILGKSYSAPLRDLRSVAHMFCNDLIEKMTGKKSFFLTKIVTSRSTKAPTKEIFVMDWDGANLMQLTNHNNAAVSPSWSRDGRYIAYSAYNYHTKIRMRNLDLFIYDLKTKQRMLLSGQRGTNSTASFFPDQKNAVIRISPNSGNSDLYKVSLSGTAQKKALTNGPRGAMNVEPAVSPDGTRLAFSSDRSGKAMIYIQDLATGSTQRLTYAGYYNSSPAWSPDGKRIAFAGGNEKHFDIFVMDADGKNLQKLTSAQKPNGKGANNEDPSFSPDGRFILFRSDRTGNYQLYVVSVDGKHEYRLTFDQNNYYRPQWSPFLN
jgi:TolB protein